MQAIHKTSSSTCSVLLSSFLVSLNRITYTTDSSLTTQTDQSKRDILIDYVLMLFFHNFLQEVQLKENLEIQSSYLFEIGIWKLEPPEGEGYAVHWGYHQCIGRYHQCIGGYHVCTGGYHVCTGGYHVCTGGYHDLCGDLISALRVFHSNTEIPLP